MARAYTGVTGLGRVKDPVIRSALSAVDTYLRDNSRAMSTNNDPASSVSVGSAPDDVAFVTIGSESRLSKERRLAASSPLVLTDGGSNGAATISLTTATLAASLTAVPNLTFSTGSATGSATTFIQSDATVALFDTTAASAIGAAAAAGTVNFAARRDHVHIYPIALRSTANGNTATLTDDGTNNILTMTPPNAFGTTDLIGGKWQFKSDGLGIYRFYNSDNSSVGLNINLVSSAGNPGVVSCTPPSMTSTATTDFSGFWIRAIRSNSSGGGNFYGYNSQAEYNATTTSTTAKEFFASKFRFLSSSSNTLGNNAGDIAGGLIVANGFVVATSRTLVNLYGSLIQDSVTVNGTLTNYFGHYVPSLGVGTNRYSFYGKNTAHFENPSGVSQTTLQLLQLNTGTATGAHINFDDKSGDATTPVAGDLWRNGAALRFYDGTNTLQLMQQATTGTTVGQTSGSGTAMLVDDTFTGSTGTTAYTMGDIVLALKNNGVLAA